MLKASTISCCIGLAASVFAGFAVSTWPCPCSSSSFLCHCLFAIGMACLSSSSPQILYSRRNVGQNHEFVQLSQCCHTEVRTVHRARALWTSHLVDVLYVVSALVTYGQVQEYSCIVPLLVVCCSCRSRDAVALVCGSAAVALACLATADFGGQARMACLTLCTLLVPFVRNMSCLLYTSPSPRD